jgi:hypothetical protein
MWYGKNGNVLTLQLPRSATLNATAPFFSLLPSATWVLSEKEPPQGLNMRQLGDIELTVLGPVKRSPAAAREREIIDSYKLGVNSCILKPVDITQFRHAVETLGFY